MLTEKNILDIQELQKLCENAEDFSLKLNWEMLKTRESSIDDYLYYEGEHLIGFLALYGFGESYELCGMVHPDYRQRGIFTDLFNKAYKSLQVRECEKLLINAPSKSQSAKGFIRSINAEYSFSEYQMEWKSMNVEVDHSEILLRRASTNDKRTIIDLDVKCFNVSEKDAHSFQRVLNNEEGHRYYMIEYKSETVGKINVHTDDKTSYIYGFAVFPEFQGKGIGRNALAQIVLNEAQKEQKIFLEVATKNENALGLYHSIGFQTYQTQDYYLHKPL
ncbi:ribosomal protein S18 acetylase RimI-like enzyme [Bacillus pakistanensis]|uniref:Ribosomal protein S18 acetylase RimI-like enzyme n=1 Tax=Rossellomorea pakistanensis TaxID=992288 RepID=A0ABS2N8J2_9BACI|nr:GNAT family N-acetyltransferase [Bacillus pakistanensis]MBM7584159.1 ribosomal protein S18 acetylase RimI-like enzyme [Bacillus pakistanensis]